MSAKKNPGCSVSFGMAGTVIVERTVSTGDSSEKFITHKLKEVAMLTALEVYRYHHQPAFFNISLTYSASAR